ncbi:hypothetical protein [Metallibacterium scheffleri]
MNTPKISVEEVLEAFSLEADAGPATLQRYLREYPQFSDELIDLSSEIFQFSLVEEGELLDTDRARMESVLAQFRSAASRAAQAALARLEPEKQRELAQALGVPRQVILAFVERGVIASTVPGRFLARMSDILRTSVRDIIAHLSQPPPRAVRYAKADDKPQEAGQVSFEQLLRDAGVSEEKTAELLRDEP